MSAFDAYLGFIGLPGFMYIVPIAICVAAAILAWESQRSKKDSLGLALGITLLGSAVLSGVLYVSSVCLGFHGAWVIAAPEWWSGVCVVVGWIVGIWILAKADGNLFIAVIGGYAACYALEWSGPYLLFPLVKYVIGYGLSILAPVVLVILVVVVVVQLLPSAKGLRWLLMAFVYFIAAAISLLVSPLLEDYLASYFADALTALAPCALAAVALGLSNNWAMLRLWIIVLYSGVGIFLFRSSSDSGEYVVNQMALSLKTEPVVWSFCGVLVATGAWHLLRLWRKGRSGLDQVPLWAVVMPWISLVPAFYFLELSLQWFVVYLVANLLFGILLFAEILLVGRGAVVRAGRPR